MVRVCAGGWLLLLATGSSLFLIPAYGITIDLNYDYDTNGFFTSNPDAKLALQFAVQAFEPMMDNLLAIQPGGTNTWTASFTSPGTGQNVSLLDLSIATDTVLIYAGGRDLDANTLGLGGPGSWSATAGFADTIRRGQVPKATDFGAWGGAIAFDTTTSTGQPRPWHFDIDTPPTLGVNDFLSVAMHELAHTFGFGISDSFDNQITGVAFHGPAVTALTGGSVDVASDFAHWDFGTTSPPYASTEPLAALNPSISPGSRHVLTPLDYAGLKDLGWEVPDQLLGLPGDLDADLDVDGSDFLRWQRGFGLTTGATATTGDADGDGGVDDYDLWILQRNFGEQGVAPSVQSAAPVPEPSSWIFLLTAAVMTLCHRGRG